MTGLSEELDGQLLNKFRSEFEKKARIRHKYGESSDFFFVLGYIRKITPGVLDLPQDIKEKLQQVQI